MVISEKKLEKLEHSKVRMTATVPMADVKSVYDEMMADYVKSVRIDGFRKGHVPPSVLERKFGASLRLEAMSRVLEKAVDAALADAEEKPLAYEAPALEGEPEFALDKDFSFSVTYDVFPHFELPSTEGIELEVPGVEVSEEDLAQELERIRERNAIVVEKTGEAALGDIVTVAYSELTEDGREVAGSKREDFTFELGKGLNLYKFDEEVVGMKAGDSKIFPKTYPGDFEYKDLAGKTVITQAGSSALTALEGDSKDLTATFAKLLETADYNSAYMELDAGAVDAIAVDVGVANYYMASKSGSYAILDEAIASEQYGVGFLKGNTETMYLVQGVLLEMAADGTMEAIAADYTEMGLVVESLVYPKAFD